MIKTTTKGAVVVISTMLLFITNFMASGQDTSNNQKSAFYLGLRYGNQTLNGGIKMFDSSLFGLSNINNDVRQVQGNSTGGMYLTGSMTLEKRTIVSVAIGHERIPGHIKRTSTGEKVGSWNDKYWIFGLETTYIYGAGKTNRSKFYLYGTLGIAYVRKFRDEQGMEAYSFEEETTNRKRLGFQLSPIGLSYGNRLRINTELGFGYSGFMVIGLSYSLTNINK